MKAPVRDKTFAAFAAAVRASCEEHAQRKNYTNSNVDGESLLTVIMQQIGIHRQHCIAEIVTRAIEYLKTPRRVLLEKIAGWAFILWRETEDAQ